MFSKSIYPYIKTQFNRSPSPARPSLYVFTVRKGVSIREPRHRYITQLGYGQINLPAPGTLRGAPCAFYRAPAPISEASANQAIVSLEAPPLL